MRRLKNGEGMIFGVRNRIQSQIEVAVVRNSLKLGSRSNERTTDSFASGRPSGSSRS